MRVAINCLSFDPTFVGGLNTYVRGLLEGFASVANGHQFRLYATGGNQRLFEGFRAGKSFEVRVLDERKQWLRKGVCRAALLSCSEKVYESTSNLVFREIRHVMEEDADIVYTPSTVLHYFNGAKPSVLSMHDIQHVHFPEFFSWPRRLSRRITYGLSAFHADVFQASSEFSKQDLLWHFQCISADKVFVIPEGVRVEDFSTPADTASICSKYAIPERFLLFPAQLWLHKNHILLLRALKQIELKRRLRIPLVLTGGKFSATSRIFGYIADQSMDYVHYLGRVPFRELVGLYQKAAFLVMPSLHESNSLPVLEAAAAGIPVIASRIPPNEELARRLCLNLFDPVNQHELEELLVRLWEDESAPAAQAIYNREHIKSFSWENAATQYLRLFDDIVNR